VKSLALRPGEEIGHLQNDLTGRPMANGVPMKGLSTKNLMEVLPSIKTRVEIKFFLNFWEAPLYETPS